MDVCLVWSSDELMAGDWVPEWVVLRDSPMVDALGRKKASAKGFSKAEPWDGSKVDKMVVMKASKLVLLRGTAKAVVMV